MKLSTTIYVHTSHVLKSSAISEGTKTKPRGWPFPAAFAIVTMSGTTPCSSKPQKPLSRDSGNSSNSRKKRHKLTLETTASEKTFHNLLLWRVFHSRLEPHRRYRNLLLSESPCKPEVNNYHDEAYWGCQFLLCWGNREAAPRHRHCRRAARQWRRRVDCRTNSAARSSCGRNL